MSREYNKKAIYGGQKNRAISITSNVPERAEEPINCKTPCCYGRGHGVCFPCWQKMLSEVRHGKQ